MSSKAAPPATVGSAPAVSTAAAPPPPNPSAQADADALTAYNGMVKAVTVEMTTNHIGAGLPYYATGNAYMTFRQAVTSDVQSNIVYTGNPQSSPTVSATDLASTPPTVKITDCFGGPGFTPVFAADDRAGHTKGHSAVGPGASTAPHPLTVTVTKRSAQWLVEGYALNAGASC